MRTAPCPAPDCRDGAVIVCRRTGTHDCGLEVACDLAEVRCSTCSGDGDVYVYEDEEPADLVSAWRRGPGAEVPGEVARLVADAIEALLLASLPAPRRAFLQRRLRGAARRHPRAGIGEVVEACGLTLWSAT